MSTPLSITELNQRVAQLLQTQIPLLWVAGEISNLTRAASGHWYFSLKDERAQVRAVMFRGRVQTLNWQPREGDAVHAYVAASLYPARGDFQLTVETLRPAGQGNLYERFNQLKNQLQAQGWFDADSKRPLPAFVRRIAVVTSPQAAALRDVAHTLARRAPHIELVLFPCLVQGELAAAQIAQAIQQANTRANARADIDAILIIRGGGSMEDLWAFNEMPALEAAHLSRLPTLSGVGHETDTTLMDFVADLRAATPTAAAELISTPTQGAYLQHLDNLHQRMQRQLHHQWQHAAQRLDAAAARLLTPKQRLAQTQSHVKELSRRLHHHTHNAQQTRSHALSLLTTRLHHNAPRRDDAQRQIEALRARIQRAQRLTIERAASSVSRHEASLQQLNPRDVLLRGYAYVKTSEGNIVYNSHDVAEHATIQIQLAHGRLTGQVTERHHDD